MNALQQIQSNMQEMIQVPMDMGRHFSRRLMKHIHPDVELVQVDMSETTEMNARGLGKLLRLQHSLHKQGKRLRLVNISMRVMLFLELTQADKILDVSWNQNLRSSFAA